MPLSTIPLVETQQQRQTRLKLLQGCRTIAREKTILDVVGVVVLVVEEEVVVANVVVQALYGGGHDDTTMTHRPQFCVCAGPDPTTEGEFLEARRSKRT